MSSALSKLLADLKQDNSIKAWSLIITFFGDAIAPRGGAVSAATIQNVMTHCGVGQGTVRTALSRLGKDGWVEREKCGRNSYYRLSARAAKESAAASAIIYAAPCKAGAPPLHKLYIINTVEDELLKQHKLPYLVSLQRGLYLAGLTDQQKQICINQGMIVGSVENDPLPYRVLESILPGALQKKYLQLQARLELPGHLQPGNDADALALRTVIIHEWRRLKLRPGQPATDHPLCPTVRQQVHLHVAKLYQHLTPAADHWLQQHAIGPAGVLSLTDIDIAKRFQQPFLQLAQEASNASNPH